MNRLLSSPHSAREIRHYQFDLGDGDGRCVAVITQFGLVGADVHEAWEDLAVSLPDA